jgi:hypothetical protein
MNLQQYSPQVTHQNEVTIKLLKQHNELTMPLLSRLTGYGASVSKRILERLASMGVCHEVKRGKKLYFVPGRAPKVQRERFEPKGKFHGIKWEPSVNRPGCEDFLQCPSRVGNQYFPHRAMMHGCTPTGARK